MLFTFCTQVKPTSGQSSVEVVRLQQDTQREAKCSSFRSWSYPGESSLSCFLEGLLQMPPYRGAEPSSDRLCHCPSLVTLCPCLPLLLTSEPARTTHYRGEVHHGLPGPEPLGILSAMSASCCGITGCV